MIVALRDWITLDLYEIIARSSSFTLNGQCIKNMNSMAIFHSSESFVG